MRLALCGDVMTGRGVDQILPRPSAPDLHEPFVKDAFPDARATIENKIVLENDGDRVTRSSHYIDVAGMMAQLGRSAGV